ncbi:MAG: NAD(P)H-dependent oxidoreductase subunit E [Chloroflexi bacterium]|nr:NAD(P)H-dependent oxidoreductase subunit E [Chloroflexota bacterium]
MPLETESKLRIRALIADLRPNNGDLLASLHRIQHEFGYLSSEALHVVAEQLDMFPAIVYGAASYYEEFRFEPPPRTQVRWCSGPACRLRNANGIRDAVMATLGVEDFNESSEDGRAGMLLGQCIGTCELAPMVWLEQHETHAQVVVGNLTAARAIRMARAIRDGGDLDAAVTAAQGEAVRG